jgi:hypothetical protein
LDRIEESREAVIGYEEAVLLLNVERRAAAAAFAQLRGTCVHSLTFTKADWSQS